MADIDKALPNVETEIKVPGEEEVLEMEKETIDEQVGPDDIQAVVHNVLRHRIILSYQAEAEGVTINDVLDKIVATVAVP